MRRSVPSRVLLTGALAVAAAGIVLAAPMAEAHVTPDPDEAPHGGFTTVVFRVPNERDDASTTGVEIGFPTDTPIASVSVQPVPGWQYTTQTATLPEPIETDDGEVTEAVTSVTYTGGAIKPGEFQQFPIEMGPMPDEGDQVLFPTLQTYDNGEIVRWIDQPNPDGTEPEHPAPAITLTAAEEDHHGNSGDEEEASGSDESGVTAENAAAEDDDSDSGNILGIVGIVLGGLGLIVAVYAVATGRRRAAAAAGGTETTPPPAETTPPPGGTD
jgi:uncharacterized protein